MTLTEQLQAAIIGDCHYGSLDIGLSCAVTLTFTCMYTFDVTFAGLDRVAELLQTDRINLTNDHEYESGCETCDYGSQTTVTIVARGVPDDVRKQLAKEGA